MCVYEQTIPAGYNLTALMPHGSWLGPLTFLLLIDDLQADCLIHKYVDDTTLTELLNPLTRKICSAVYRLPFSKYSQLNDG